MADKASPIGVFDSGVGGISVLRELVRLMPNENFLYYGDSANAPYGTRPLEEIRELSMAVVDYLLANDVKGIVVACNTATSAVVRKLRTDYPGFPVVGIEPALKPAVLAHPGGTVMVLATVMTLQQPKFHHLLEQYTGQATILPVAASELVEFVERGELNSPALEQAIEGIMAKCPGIKPDAMVLGCTHFPFVRPVLERMLPDCEVFDGGEGTARYTRYLLEQANLLNDADQEGYVEFVNSCGDAEKLLLSYQLLDA